MNAQDPSHLVQQPLQNHVHLISSYRFPLLPSLNIEQALRYLVDAPTIVKAGAAMAWLYIQAPQDGTAWLEWIPPRNGEYRFASDGYVWADPEQTMRQEFGGYTMEWMTHTLGYRPNHEQVATHARTRFHFIAKNPNINAPVPDSSLWIVHYHQADQNRMLPVQQIPVAVQTRQILNERRWLEMQGRLEKKDFMLHDRDHWPTITVPTSAHMQQAMQQQQQQAQYQQQQQGMFANNPAMQQQVAGGVPRFPQQQAFPSAQGPPAKRPRHSGPEVMPASSDAPHDAAIQEDEQQATDWFDHLTPRDISKTRYIQHHQWMEEVFSSPYATSRIVPPDLGLGLMGELKGLTDGILDPPAVDDVKEIPLKEKSRDAREAQPFSNLKREQVDEFNKRVDKHLEDGRAELERMKKEHAEKMAEWKRTKTLMQAEKRLRYATWEGHESAVSVFQLETSDVNGHLGEDTRAPETVEDVVKDVESLLGVKVQSYKDATMLQRGGLEKEEDLVRDEMVQDGENDSEKDEFQVLQSQKSMIPANSGSMSAGEHGFNGPPDSAQESSMANQMLDIPTAATPSVSPAEQNTGQTDVTAQQGSGLDDSTEHHDLDAMGMNMGDASLMDIDVDVDTGDIDFVHHDEDELGEDPTITPIQPSEVLVEPLAESTEVSVQDELQQVEDIPLVESETGLADVEQLTQAEEAIAPPPAEETLDDGAEDKLQVAPESVIPDIAPNVDLGNEAVPSPEQQPEPLQQPALGEPDLTGMVDTGTDEHGLFDDGTFDDLTDMDGDGNDDGLIDFDGGMGMEESAFGDALHGMDNRTPDVGGDGGDARQEG